MAKSSAEIPVVPGGDRLAGRRILIVDDAHVVRRTVAAQLRAEGADAQDAMGGAQALHKLAAAASAGHPFDLLILDLDMPRVSGFDVLRDVRTRNLLEDLPVVVLTGDDKREDVLRCKALGVLGYVLKPSSLDTLVSTVVRCLERTPDEKPVAAPEPKGQAAAPAEGEDKGGGGEVEGRASARPVVDA
jgi:CheY-like chemotaxis protein